jgi:hypothetical protein
MVMTDPSRRGIPTDPQAALRTLRILWAALLAGPVAFLVVVAVVLSGGGTAPASDLATILGIVAFVLLIAGVFGGYTARLLAYRRGSDGQRITPQAYFTGNLILFASCEAVALFSIVASLVVGQFGVVLIPAVLAMAVQVLNFPTGRLMLAETEPYDTLMK